MGFDTFELFSLFTPILDEIIRITGKIQPQLCLNVVENFNRRMEIYGAARNDVLSP